MVWKQLVDYRGLEGIARKLYQYDLIPDYTAIWHRIHDLIPEISIPEWDDIEAHPTVPD